MSMRTLSSGVFGGAVFSNQGLDLELAHHFVEIFG